MTYAKRCFVASIGALAACLVGYGLFHSRIPAADAETPPPVYATKAELDAAATDAKNDVVRVNAKTLEELSRIAARVGVLEAASKKTKAKK